MVGRRKGTCRVFSVSGAYRRALAKKPRVDFKKLDEGAKMGAKVLCGQELHNHLVANCAISDEIAWPETPAEEFSSLEKMKAHLKTGNSVQINSY